MPPNVQASDDCNVARGDVVNPNFGHMCQTEQAIGPCERALRVWLVAQVPLAPKAKGVAPAEARTSDRRRRFPKCKKFKCRPSKCRIKHDNQTFPSPSQRTWDARAGRRRPGASGIIYVPYGINYSGHSCCLQ